MDAALCSFISILRHSLCELLIEGPQLSNELRFFYRRLIHFCNLRLFSGGINVNNHVDCLGSPYGWGLCAIFTRSLVGRLASPYPEASYRWTTSLPEAC